MCKTAQFTSFSIREFFTNSAILALDRCKLCTLPGNGGIKSNQPKEILYARFQRIEPVHGFIDFALFYCAIWLLLRDRFCCERGYRTVRSTATSTWMEIWRGTSARLIPKQIRADAINAPAHLHRVSINPSRTGTTGNDIRVQRHRAIPRQCPALQIYPSRECDGCER
jgi:hypothetical protein